jgi:predicted TIM-barrel fold metal-dependent hydrolase
LPERDAVAIVIRVMRLLAGKRLVRSSWVAVVAAIVAASSGRFWAAPAPLFNDSHFHLTNYVQKGPSIHDFVRLVGDKVGRVAVFGIPLQQEWSHALSGDKAPTYYLQSDAPLYYYSFTDAYIALEYRSLSRAQQARFDPMITGFNPGDMYAVDHIRRVLQAFPGVFSGIGEFSVHKEFVSAKTAGGPASLLDPALDRILDFAGEVGLIALLHNDLDTPFAKAEDRPAYLDELAALFRRHPKTTIIWAHLGLGRVIRPVEQQGEIVKRLLEDPALAHVYCDISWNELAKYLYRGEDPPKTLARVAAVINAHPTRFLFGSDEVAPTDLDQYLSLYRQYGPLWEALTPDAREKTLKANYVRLFDAARLKVRAWEKTHPHR